MKSTKQVLHWNLQVIDLSEVLKLIVKVSYADTNFQINSHQITEIYIQKKVNNLFEKSVNLSH